MDDVNSNSPDSPSHLAYLLHMGMRSLRARAEAAADASTEPLQAAPARLLDLIPPTGGRVTDLAQTMRISKQGLGQLAMQLANRGYVKVTPDPSDKRAKLIATTEAGRRYQQTMRDLIADIERSLRDEVGDERYAIFRDVLTSLATPRGLR